VERSSFISSFDRALGSAYDWAAQTLGVGTYYFWRYGLLIFLFLLSFLLLLKYRDRISQRARGFSWALIAIGIIRVLLFESPAAWNSYLNAIPPDTLSFLTARQKAAELRNRQLIPAKLDFLIVGSSAMKYALTGVKKWRPRTEFIYAYGMRAMEAAFCRREVKSFNPSLIILYLTEYELGNITWEDAKYQSFYSFADLEFPVLYARLGKVMGLDRLTGYFLRSLTGFIFPEYRYSFIFRALINKLLGRPFRARFSELPPDRVLELKIQDQLGSMKKILRSPSWSAQMDINLLFLNDFLRFCRGEGIRVVLLQGRLHPRLETERTETLRLVATPRLEALAAAYANARFIPDSEFPPLVPDDFRDLMHLTEAACDRYSRSVLEYLRKMPPFPER
jgi:hypothetical protein